MSGERKTFQNRVKRIEDDGADFERFVFECFRYAKEEAGFAKRLARGRDGSIDLLDRRSEPGAATVVECKYIGSGSAKEAATRWREVSTRLRTHLPILAADPATNPNSPYRGWLDPERPITRYRFCVTAEMTDAQLRALETEIVQFFSNLVSNEGVDALAALAANQDNNVCVLRWDWFAAELDAHPTLAFRWFRGLPVGVELFDPETGAEATFRDFLRSGELRYFSRDDYLGLQTGRFEDGESDLIGALAGGDTQGLLISGPGGVGKTRLSWELATALADSASRFDVYSLRRGAGFASITGLAARYLQDASILLLFDYAEAARSLSEVADAVEHVSSNTGHRIRLVATCRASAANAVRDALMVLQVREKSLGSARTGERDYADWVTRSILRLEDLPRRCEIEQVCHGVPALAAFALFLYRGHRARFDAQFGALHGVVDFDRWAAHRISSLVARTAEQNSAAERTLALVALSLPMHIDEFRRFESTHGPLVAGLRDDRWIEQEGDHFFSAHDVLADALAARWLFESDNAATDRVGDLLAESARQGGLERSLIVIERLVPHPKFSEIDGSRVLAGLITRHPDQVVVGLRLLLSGSLLSLWEKLDLLHDSEVLQNYARGDRSIDAPLSRLAEQAAKQRLTPGEFPALTTLLDLLEHALAGEQGSNMVLRRAFALDPMRFRERAFGSIREFPGSETTHFLFVQMLKSGESTDELDRLVRYWADRNATAHRASFLYRAWLDRSGSIDAVETPLLAWVADHGRASEAQFVYKAWLDRGGSIEAVEKPLLAWVAEHGTTHEAQFVYSAWLDRGGSIEAVEKPLLAWVAEHGTTPGAGHVYTAWLNRGGSIEALEKPLLAWVAEHGTTPGAQFVYKAWLDRGGSIEAVEAPLLVWVAECGTTPEAQFVYSAWLNRGGSIEAVEKQLLAWVAEHGTTHEARFVYKAWLDRGGSIEAVEKQLLTWVAEHGTTPEAQFVYNAWLDRGGSIEPVEKRLLAWVAEHGTTHEAQFVYNAWLDRGGSIEAVEKRLLAWVAEHGMTPEASHVYKAWLDRGGSIEAVEKRVLAWVSEHGTTLDAPFVFRAWLNRGGDLESVREQMYAWIVLWHTEAETAFVTRHLVKRNDLPEPVIVAIASWAVTFIGHEDSLDRLSNLLAHVHDDSMTEAGFLRLISLAEDAIIGSLRRDRLSDKDRSVLWRISAGLTRRSLFGRNPRGCLRAVALVVKSGRVFKRGLGTHGADFLLYTYGSILNAVMNAISWGDLSIKSDAKALHAFRDWMRSSAPDHEGLEDLLRALQRRV